MKSQPHEPDQQHPMDWDLVLSFKKKGGGELQMRTSIHLSLCLDYDAMQPVSSRHQNYNCSHSP